MKTLRETALEIRKEDERHRERMAKLEKANVPWRELEHSVNVAQAMLVHQISTAEILNPFNHRKRGL